MNTTSPIMIDPNQLSEQQLVDLLQSKRNKVQQDRKAYKDLVNTTVPAAVTRLIDLSRLLAAAKKDTFSYFKDLLELKASVYGMSDKKKNPQQSHTFSTEKYCITIGYRINDGWDDTVNEGIAKVNAFIESLATNFETSKLVRTIFRLLKKDAKGNLRASRVLELKQMSEDYHNADFTDGVNTILEAYRPVRTCWFIEASFMNDNQEKVSIPLSISSVDFPVGFEFDFLSPDDKKETNETTDNA